MDKEKSSTKSETGENKPPIWVLAAFLAWLVPGAGHLYLNRAKRGLIIFITVTMTFWTGIAIGGVMTVDRHTNNLWFVAQMGTGINGLISWYRQESLLKEYGFAGEVLITDRGDTSVVMDELASDGYALVAPNEDPARAYTGIIGMMNILAIFDAAMLAMMGVCGEPSDREKKDE